MHRTHDLIASFDRYLEARGLHFDAVVIGGAALNLLGVVSRLTKDCDILFPEIPEEIVKASQTFAREARRIGGDLVDEWLNNGPASLQTQLLPGWEGESPSSRIFWSGYPLTYSGTRGSLMCEAICSLRSWH